MATLILTKRNITNTSAPLTGDLQIGEIAVNVMDDGGDGCDNSSGTAGASIGMYADAPDVTISWQ